MAFTFAPLRSRPSTASRLPTRAAAINAVSPLLSDDVGSAPAASSTSTRAAWPFVQAMRMGVTPSSFAAFTSAPAPIRSAAVSRSLPVSRPVERRGTIGLRCVHVRTTVEQSPHHVYISASDGVHDSTRPRLTSHSTRGCVHHQEQRDESRADDAVAVFSCRHASLVAARTGLTTLAPWDKSYAGEISAPSGYERSKRPVLSWSLSIRIPNFSSTLRCRFASGGSLGYRR